MARSRGARALTFVLALLLVVGNIAAAATPVLGAASEHGGNAVAHAAADSGHCMHEDAKAADAHKPMRHHGQDCPCCAGKACACVNACPGLIAITTPLTVAPPRMPKITAFVPSAYASFSAPLLRPPIA